MFTRDLIGLAALWILFGLGELYKKDKRQLFIKTGRIILDESNNP